MDVVYCDNCRVKTTPDNAVHGNDGKLYCAECAPLFKVTAAAPIQKSSQPSQSDRIKSPSKFYFCETCGKRVTDVDIERGGARDKKVKGYYCKECAVGVMTIEFAAIKDVPVAAQTVPVAAPPPNPGSRAGLTPAHRSTENLEARQKSRNQLHPAHPTHPVKPARADERDVRQERRERSAIPTTTIVGVVLVAATAFAITVALFSGGSKGGGASAQTASPPVAPTTPKENATTRPVTDLPAPAPPAQAAQTIPSPPVPVHAGGEAPRVAPPSIPAKPTQPVEVPKVPVAESPPKTVTKTDASAAFEPGASITYDFESELDKRWHVEGATLSDEQAHEGKKSLKVNENQTATMRFGAGADLPVKVRFWVYDNGRKFGTRVADGPKWGVTDSAGNTFCLRLAWRPFLAGDNNYAWTSTAENKWFSVWHSPVRRKDGWMEWVFDFTNPAAATITGGRTPVTPVTAKVTPKGAVAISLFGGGTESGPLYIDDISVEYPKK